MTDQEVYEASRAWIARPGATRCYDETSCRYRDEHGNKCAIGGILPDKIMDSTVVAVDGMEVTVADYQGAIDVLIPSSKIVRDFFQWNKTFLLVALQSAHDESIAGSEWQGNALAKMDEAARKYGLKVVTA